MPSRWVLPADPCTVCVAHARSVAERARAFALPHTCSRTLTRAFAIPVAGADAYPCAFTRALRDA